VKISICSRRRKYDPKYFLQLQRPPIKPLPPSFNVAVTLARIRRKPLPQSGTNHLHACPIKITNNKKYSKTKVLAQELRCHRTAYKKAKLSNAALPSMQYRLFRVLNKKQLREFDHFSDLYYLKRYIYLSRSIRFLSENTT
jgi:hypothetical protein